MGLGAPCRGQQEAVESGQGLGSASRPTSRLAQGFHRYSTDRQWHVPHFEKMLYDQGQLVVAYSQAFQVPRPQPVCLPLAASPKDFLVIGGSPLTSAPIPFHKPSTQVPSSLPGRG